MRSYKIDNKVFDHYEKARWFLRRRRLEEALVEFYQITDLIPGDREAREAQEWVDILERFPPRSADVRPI